MAEVILRASRRYRRAGRWAHGFAQGKMSRDPVYASVLEQIPEEGVLLDVGCGEGYLLALVRALQPAVRLVGLDHDPRRVETGRVALGDESSLEFRVADAREAELPSADVVTCLDVLHYMSPPEQDALIERLAAALEPGGLLLLREAQAGAGIRSAATRWSERILVALGRHKGDGVFLRPRAELRDRLEGVGLRVEERDCSEGTPFANVLFVARRDP